MGLIDSVVSKLFGSKADKDLKQVDPVVEKIKAEYAKLAQISNDELRAKADDLKQRIKDNVATEQGRIDELKRTIEQEDDVLVKEKLYEEVDSLEKTITEKIETTLEEILPAAFAVIKETARRFTDNETVEVTASDFDRSLATRHKHIEIKGNTAVWQNTWAAGGNDVTWDMVHYDVQLIGGIALHSGKIAEMATGEGKTLVATLPVFLNALTGRGVHVVTVNDYLAKRDAEWMGPLYEFHGLSVDCIDKHEPHSEGRVAAYNSDITFGTNNEFGFDYLRDNMSLSPDELVQRPHNYAIVDEVDSVLIDDARTPLIISGPVAKGENQQFLELKPKVEKLVKAQRELFNKRFAEAKKMIGEEKKESKEEGFFKLLQVFKMFPKNNALIKFRSEPGIQTSLIKTEDIYLAENAKRMPEVTDELFFVIDEKTNSVDMTDKGIDLITGVSDDPHFFVMPDIGSEIADIEKNETDPAKKLELKDKLLADFAIKSERIHTINQLLRAYSLFEKDVEYVVMENKVKIVDEQTGRIMEGRRYSDGLHQAIEAKENVKVEAATQTFATITLQNYFRMYNKLSGMTGTAITEAGEFWDIYKLDVMEIPTNRHIQRFDREDLVFKTRREKYNSVIDEIEKIVKENRPVLVGTTSVEISELLSRMLQRKAIDHNVLNAKLHKREADIVAQAGQAGFVTIATNMAGRGTDIKLTKEVKDSGGLAIIGTERHESRRVDRQLRGRAGRQGDPGSSQFFVSLEDDLMRMFGSDRISKVMDRLGHEDGDVIQHSMITKSIERAQRKVEENNFGIRKRLLEYDDVMNSQREVVYKQRKHALHGERIGVDIANMMYDLCQTVTERTHGQVDFQDFQLEVYRSLSIEALISEQDFKDLPATEVTEKLYAEMLTAYRRKSKAMQDQAWPVIKHHYEESNDDERPIIVPFADGQKIWQIPVSLKTAYDTQAKELVKAFEKTAILLTIDEAWKEHLREMDDLKQSVQSATYEQKDPLLIYKFESFNLFQQMIDKNNQTIVSTLMKGHIPVPEERETQRTVQTKQVDTKRLKTSRPGEDDISKAKAAKPDGSQGEPKVETYVRTDKKVGRNEPCPCGSGKKFKQCCGRGQ